MAVVLTKDGIEIAKTTFADIAKANASITSTKIQNKDYVEVNQRIKAFRMVNPNGSIITEIISNEGGVVVFKATVKNEEGDIIATGTAYEKEGSSYINKTSYIENCETSAVGRALGMAGFGIDTSIASFEEVTNAINQQQKEEPQIDVEALRSEMFQELSEKQIKWIIDKKGYTSADQVTQSDRLWFIEQLKKGR